jgi:plasmid stability protein
VYTDQPLTINPGFVERIAHCPAAEGAGTRLTRGSLDRWIAVRDACASWHNGMEADEAAATHFAPFDPVQRPVCETLFRRYTNLMNSARDEWDDLEGDQLVVPHPNENAFAAASVTFTLRTDDDAREHIKLRTGRHGSSVPERAILQAGADAGDSLTEVLAATGITEDISLDEETTDRVLAELFTTWDAQQNRETRGTRPGWWCFTCPRPARCGQYPTPDGVRVPASTRTIVLPKTWAVSIARCERRVAWKQIHQIPRDDWTEDADWHRDRGIAFHEMAAVALGADDPDEAFAGLLADIPPSEQQNMSWLWERTIELEAEHEHPVEVVDTEYQVGTTVLVDGSDIHRGRVAQGRKVAVVFTGRADATGREPDGTPAVIELKTGPGATEFDQIEADIYAAGAALITGSTSVAVHFHQIGLAGGPRCVRVPYADDDLRDAVTRLQSVAAGVAAWHPEDASVVDYATGPWCQGCPFQARCEDHRD